MRYAGYPRKSHAALTDKLCRAPAPDPPRARARRLGFVRELFREKSLLCLLVRPFGVAVGILVLVNLGLALQDPTLATTEIWLSLLIPEPLQALLASVLGVALLMPHRLGYSPSARWLLGGIFCGYSVLVASSAIGFYHGMRHGRFTTDFPLPVSVFIFLILLVEFSRMWWWTPQTARLPPPARIFFSATAVVVAFLLVTLSHVVSFGRTDFRREADAAVIFGAKVHPDGEPCAALRDRLDIGIDLYHRHYVDYLIMTGGRDPNGLFEPEVMLEYAVARGVPQDRVLRDDEGHNTLASARNCQRIASEVGFKRLLAVTQYFHCARVKLLFERAGLECFTVPTSSSRNPRGGEDDYVPVKLSREGFFLLREVIAFPFYFLFG